MLTTPRDLVREAEIVKLRAGGWSNNQISRLLKLTPQRVSKIYQRWLKEQSKEETNGNKGIG